MLFLQHPIPWLQIKSHAFSSSRWSDGVTSCSIFGVRLHKWPLTLSPRGDLSGGFDLIERSSTQCLTVTVDNSSLLLKRWGPGIRIASQPKQPKSQRWCHWIKPVPLWKEYFLLRPSSAFLLQSLFEDRSASQTVVHYSSNQFMR